MSEFEYGLGAIFLTHKLSILIDLNK